MQSIVDFFRDNWSYIIICFIVLLVGIIIFYKRNSFEYLENVKSVDAYLNKDVTLECDYKSSKYYLCMTPLSECSNLSIGTGECINNVATLQKVGNNNVFRLNKSFTDEHKYKLTSISNSRPYLSQNLNLLGTSNLLCFDNGEGNMIYFELESSDNKYIIKFTKKDTPYYLTACDNLCNDNVRVCLSEDKENALKFAINTGSHSDISTESDVISSEMETNKLPVNSEK